MSCNAYDAQENGKGYDRHRHNDAGTFGHEVVLDALKTTSFHQLCHHDADGKKVEGNRDNAIEMMMLKRMKMILTSHCDIMPGAGLYFSATDVLASL